jgi:hypothetical protein
MNYWAWVVLLHLRAHHRDHSPSFLWWPGLFFSTIYLSLSIHIWTNRPKRSLTKCFCGRRRQIEKGPNEIYLLSYKTWMILICFRKETKTLWSRSCQTSTLIIIIEHGARLPLMLATCDAYFPVGSALLCCAKTLLVS